MFTHNQINKIKLYDYIFYCIGILLIRIPPFYITPIHHALLSTHSLARYLFIFLFCTSIIRLITERKKYQLPLLYCILLLFYFATQSISIINANNIIDFLLIYKNIAFGLVIFLTGLIIFDSTKKINILITTIFASSIVLVLFQSIIYFQIPILTILEKYMYENYWEGVKLNMQRNKFFIDIYDTSLIPLILSFVVKEKRHYQLIFYYFLCGMISFFSLVSNFRTHILMLFFSIITSSIFILKKGSYLIITLGVFFTFLIIANTFSINVIGSNTLDRITNPVEEDYSTIDSRFEWWGMSVDMAMNYPIFGVGLGNYFDNLSPSLKTPYYSLNDTQHELRLLTLNHPHNIFFGVLAETGFLGLIALVALLLYFLITDYKLMTSSNINSRGFILSFWCLFLFALFNPPTTIPYITLFWLLRLLIHKSSLKI